MVKNGLAKMRTWQGSWQESNEKDGPPSWLGNLQPEITNVVGLKSEWSGEGCWKEREGATRSQYLAS